MVEHTAENRGVAGSIPALAIFGAPQAGRKNVYAAEGGKTDQDCARKKGRWGRCLRAANVLVT